MSRNPNTRKWYARPGIFLVGLGFFPVRLAPLLAGRAFFQTYCGAAMFAPIPVVGALAMYMPCFVGTTRKETAQLIAGRSGSIASTRAANRLGHIVPPALLNLGHAAG